MYTHTLRNKHRHIPWSASDTLRMRMRRRVMTATCAVANQAKGVLTLTSITTTQQVHHCDNNYRSPLITSDQTRFLYGRPAGARRPGCVFWHVPLSKVQIVVNCAKRKKKVTRRNVHVCAAMRAACWREPFSARHCLDCKHVLECEKVAVCATAAASSVLVLRLLTADDEPG